MLTLLEGVMDTTRNGRESRNALERAKRMKREKRKRKCFAAIVSGKFQEFFFLKAIGWFY